MKQLVHILGLCGLTNKGGNLNYILPLVLGLLVFGVVLFTFFKVGDCGLINLDDYDYLNHAHNVSSFGVTDCSQAIWMPLTWASYKLDFLLSGVAGAAVAESASALKLVHLHSGLVHAVNAVLVFALLAMLMFSTVGNCESKVNQPVDMTSMSCIGVYLIAVAGALLWGLHPLRVESVAWVASRKDVISMLFLLLALISWIRFRLMGSEGVGRHQLISYSMALLFFVLGAMAKPSVMVFPAIVCFVDLLLLRSRQVQISWLDLKRRWASLLLPYVPFTVLAMFLGVLAAYAQHVGGAMGFSAEVALFWRVVNAVTSIGIDLFNTVWPLGLFCEPYMRFPALPRDCLLGCAVCMVFITGIWILSNHAKRSLACFWCVVGMCWFLVTLSPMLGIVGFGAHAYADRFTYIPSLGLSLAFVGGCMGVRCKLGCGKSLKGKGVAQRFSGKIVLPFLCVLSIVALSICTIRQIGYWKDDETLWNRTLSIDGDGNFIALGILGCHHFEITHDLGKCVAYLDSAIKADGKEGMRIGLLYLIALVEKGCRDRLQDALLAFDTWMKRRFDKKDTANQLLAEVIYQFGREDPALPPGDGFERAEKLLKDAGDAVNMLVESDYVRYLMAKRKGDENAARLIRDRMIGNRDGYPNDAYLRFRFLQKE